MTERTLTLPTTRTPTKHLQTINERSVLIQDPGKPSFSSHKRVMPLGFCFAFSLVLCMTVLFFNPSILSSSSFRDVLSTTSYSSLYRSPHFPNVVSHLFPSPPFEQSQRNKTLNFSGSGEASDEIKKKSYEVEGRKDIISNDKARYESSVPSKGTNTRSPEQENNSQIQTGRNGVEGLDPPILEAKEGESDKGRNVDRSRERSRNGNGFEMMNKCNIFDGKWVKDDSYPLYEAGSCPFIDEPFDCYLNGRPDNVYEKYRWQPNHCNIPRLDGKKLLKLLRGKRFVFVGDSLNRNMWESLVCILRNSVKNKSRVFEVSGREEFRSEGSYSFIFQDYGLSVEFFRSPFLLQEWETPVSKGRKKKKKKTLRLDLVDNSSSRFKSADILVFNTGHWWTHEKTSKGKNYYQEGKHVYSKLNVNKAFRRAMRTWGRWIDANINPWKTFVIFRSYSASHFGGGQWNTGGVCDGETEPIIDDEDLPEYPPLDIVKELEYSLEEMKTPVFYLNITRISDYRKDAHPSINRKQNATEEERRTFSGFQDCSHWCLPGVPDTWNELLYAKLLHHHKQKQLESA